MVKELDYQFRMQEEREEARDRMLAQRDEEHFKKMDELLRKKAKRLGREKAEKNREKGEGDKPETNTQEEEGLAVPEKKKRRFF